MHKKTGAALWELPLALPDAEEEEEDPRPGRRTITAVQQ
jgi:hypothetical protein